MKKLGFLIFGATLVVGVILANFTSFGSSAIKSPLSYLFGSKIHGSGNIISETRNTGEFSGVQVGGILNVEIKRAEKLSVVVEADDNIAPNIKTVVKAGVLKIWSEKSFKSHGRVTVRVTAPNIESIDTSGVANVIFTGVSNESLEIEASGASKVELEGTVDSLDVDMSGASKVKASKLVAARVEVDGSGASALAIKVTSALRADLSGASSVRYTGDPLELQKSVSGAGKVRKID
ncbi:MAG: DUF2807 domain-containing protein [Acidobacteriota bacterium]|nr:DUF2807 domain-containing protein [Acidobacteriota bacterium]MDH3528554.1 DUF2807 domain-containing protein [Acidobacteriota bacterium]